MQQALHPMQNMQTFPNMTIHSLSQAFKARKFHVQATVQVITSSARNQR
jgi:hypothetical protein